MPDNLNFRVGDGRGFASLLYYNFIFTKKYRVDKIAEKMGIAADTLYRYIRGELTMPPDRVPDLVNSTGDTDYLQFFLGNTGFLAVPEVRIKLHKKSMKQIELDATILQGKLLEATELALEDGKIDTVELRLINDLSTKLRSKIMELVESAKKYTGDQDARA